MPFLQQGFEESAVFTDPKADENNDLIGEFRRRFPLIDSLLGQFGEGVKSESIPWFFGFILAAAANPSPGACCVVLDKTRGTVAIAAILSGLLRLKRDFPSLVENYARTALQRGQRVKVNPNGFVYEYEGVWEEYPKFFKLKVLDESASRSFPLDDVLRLEPTERVLPKGTGAILGDVERSPLDRLLDLTSSGNNSLIRNAVLVQMPQTQLARITESTVLVPRHAEQFDHLSSFLPWGSIGHDGTLSSNDEFQVVGEPLIAATSVSEDLALACQQADIGAKPVLADGARGLARNLQAFDDIADLQRLVILASPDEYEDVKLLNDRGCPVWHMSADEVLVGESAEGGRNRASLVGATIRAAEVRRRCSVNTVKCHDDVLQAAATSLERVVETTVGYEEKFEVEEILARLFRVLFESSECCFGIPEGTIGDLRVAREQMSQQTKRIKPADREQLRSAVNTLESALFTRCGEQKADAFVSILSEHVGTWAVAARSTRTAEKLRESLKGLGSDLSVLPISTFGRNNEFDGIIVPGWPNDQRFTRLKNLSITPDIRILTYPFEQEWFERHQVRERVRSRSNQMDARMLSDVLGIERRFLSFSKGASDKDKSLGEKEISLDLPVFRLEDRIARRRVAHSPLASSAEDGRKAQFIQFYGGCYALLTEWAELPMLNDLIDGANREKAKFFSRTASQLSAGDFVLFRAAGDKEFTRLIAEESLGVHEYQRIREVAERWKLPLRRLGNSPSEVQRKLASSGLSRTPPTVAGWLGNPDRIGPRDDGDIEFIATLAGDSELLSIKDDVRDAIKRIRGAHLTAGSVLTRLILGEIRGRFSELTEQPTQLDLDYGHAWIVQVESVDTECRVYPSNQVNRLLWHADSVF